jgi:hypothetical protein
MGKEENLGSGNGQKFGISGFGFEKVRVSAWTLVWKCIIQNCENAGFELELICGISEFYFSCFFSVSGRGLWEKNRIVVVGLWK